MSQDANDDPALPETHRWAATLADELAAEFDEVEVEVVSGPGSRHRFVVKNGSLTGMTTNAVTEMAARHGFRVNSIADDGRRLTFVRMQHSTANARSGRRVETEDE